MDQQTAGLRVLIADGSASPCAELRAAVEALGHRVGAAGSEGDALGELAGGAVDVFVAGGEELERLCLTARREAPRYVYVVALAGRDDLGRALGAVRAGADDHLLLPIDLEELESTLIGAERVLSLHRRLEARGGELADANSRLSKEARADPLTGAGNRLRLAEDLETLMAASLRYGLTVWLAACEIDNFRAFTDRRGRRAGDVVLGGVADAIRQVTRSADRLYRSGPEQLAVLMTEQNRDGAAIGAERLRAAIEDLRIDHPESPAGVVTVSVGVAGTMGDDGLGADELLRRSRAALLLARQGGRNRVVIEGLASAPGPD